MLIRSQATTLLQMFCELLLYSQVILKGMRVADDTFWRNSKCEWVNQLHAITLQELSISWTSKTHLTEFSISIDIDLEKQNNREIKAFQMTRLIISHYLK